MIVFAKFVSIDQFAEKRTREYKLHFPEFFNKQNNLFSYNDSFPQFLSSHVY